MCFRPSNDEPNGICCASGKVKLQPLIDPPEPLSSYVSGENAISRHFLLNIRKYNSIFQMTSFGANIVGKSGFMPTFKIHGQIYHYHGALLPNTSDDSKFLQIYFMDNSEHEIETRCSLAQGTRREIIENLQKFLHENNNLVNLFKTALEQMPSDNYKKWNICSKKSKFGLFYVNLYITSKQKNVFRYRQESIMLIV